MRRLRPDKLHTRFAGGSGSKGPIVPRFYTLTHSDATGDLYLTIGPEYNRRQIAGWYTRLLRDEVLAEWREGQDGLTFYIHCHVSGGLIFGPAGWRNAIFGRELPLVIEAIRFGDRVLFEAHPDLDRASIRVCFHATQSRYDRTETWGVFADYV